MASKVASVFEVLRAEWDWILTPIAIEGEETLDGRVIAPGAIALPEPESYWAKVAHIVTPIPLMDSRDGQYEIVARLSRYWRDGDTLFAYVPHRFGMLDFAVDLGNIDVELVDDVVVFLSCELLAVTITSNPAWKDLALRR